MTVAYLRLDELDAAISTAERGLEVHPEEDGLWSIYADVLRRAGRLPGALRALDRVEEINPDYPNLGLRRGSWLIEAGRIEEAVDALAEVAERDPGQADVAAQLVVFDAFANGIQQDRYDYAITALRAAQQLPNLGEESVHQMNFWLGYAILRSASEEQEARTVETARATLPDFREALELLENVGDYPATVNVNIDQLRSNVNAFIAIQEAIIARGG